LHVSRSDGIGLASEHFSSNCHQGALNYQYSINVRLFITLDHCSSGSLKYHINTMLHDHKTTLMTTLMLVPSSLKPHAVWSKDLIPNAFPPGKY
jgi:hypothetical protein